METPKIDVKAPVKSREEASENAEPTNPSSDRSHETTDRNDEPAIPPSNNDPEAADQRLPLRTRARKTCLTTMFRRANWELWGGVTPLILVRGISYPPTVWTPSYLIVPTLGKCH